MWRRPKVWGFGAVGWLALAVLLALVARILFGVDLQYQFLRLINATLGWTGLSYFVIGIIPWMWFQVTEPIFSLSGLAWVLLAIVLSHRRTSPLIVSAWCIWACSQSLLFWPLYQYLPVYLFGFDRLPGIYPIQTVLELCVTGYLVALTTNRRSLVATVLLAIAASRLLYFRSFTVSYTSRFSPFFPLTPPTPSSLNLFLACSTPWLYHICLACALLWWSFSTRQAFRLALSSTVLCRTCGYSLAGLSTEHGPPTCPECGTVSPPNLPVIPTGRPVAVRR